MSLSKKLFLGAAPACTTDTADIFGDSSGFALYPLNYDASDVSGSHNGTVSGGVTFGVDGQINWGASFDGGSSTHIEIPDNDVFSPLVNDFSVSMWVKPTSGHVMSKQGEWHIRTYGGGTDGWLEFVLYRSGGGSFHSRPIVTYNTGITDGDWHHLVVTADHLSSYKIYLDGVKIEEKTSGFSGEMRNTTNPVYIGSKFSNTTERYVGDLDQVRFFQKALIQSEVDTLYAETACVYTSTTDNNDYPVTNTAYYKLDNNAEDAKGNYDGTETDITYKFGRFGQAAVFNGSSSKIAVPDSGDNLNFSNHIGTISAWVNLDSISGGEEPILGKRGSGSPGARSYIVNVTNGVINWYTYNTDSNAQQVSSTSTLSANKWHHISVTLDQTNIKIYIDGVLDKTASSTYTSIQDDSADFTIGYRGSNSGHVYFDGSIDQVRIFDSALDATAVEKLYNEKPEINTSNFETVLYEGNGGSQYVSNVGFEPDLVWIKSRGINYDHQLHDSVRGAGNGLLSNSTVASVFYNTVTSFDSNGFFVNAPGTYVGTNANNQDFVAWCWKAGGDAVLNEQGTIDSQVSANTAAGFSIVKYTGSGSQPQTVGHGLSSAPEMIIYKNLNTTFNWHVYHESVMNAGDAKFLRLNTSDALLTDGQADVWTSGFSATTFGIGDANNASGNDHLAYCFHSVAGYQKIGSYTGTGSSGNSVVTGFQPRFVMIKRADNGTGGWVMIDSTRSNTGNPINDLLNADSSNAESVNNANNGVDFNSNGFTLQGTSNGTNGTNTYIYLAIA